MFHDKSFRMTQNKNNAIFSIISMAFMGSNYVHDVLGVKLLKEYMTPPHKYRHVFIVGLIYTGIILILYASVPQEFLYLYLTDTYS